jgi:hypothetical protein
MPSLPTIRLANTSLPPSALPLTAVFASATSGLAFLTLRALSLRFHPFKAYVIGRAASSAAFHAAVADLPSSTEIVYLEAELSLLAEAKRVGDVIAAKETRIDLLMLTTGYAPFNGRQSTCPPLPCPSPAHPLTPSRKTRPKASKHATRSRCTPDSS